MPCIAVISTLIWFSHCRSTNPCEMLRADHWQPLSHPEVALAVGVQARAAAASWPAQKPWINATEAAAVQTQVSLNMSTASLSVPHL